MLDNGLENVGSGSGKAAITTKGLNSDTVYVMEVGLGIPISNTIITKLQNIELGSCE